MKTKTNRMNIFQHVAAMFCLSASAAPTPESYGHKTGPTIGYKASPLLSRKNRRPNKYRPHQGNAEKARRRQQRKAWQT